LPARIEIPVALDVGEDGERTFRLVSTSDD
jgi:hypothetical protein